MTQFFELSTWREILASAVADLGTVVSGFLPSLLGAVLILVVGWAVSRTVSAISVRGLRSVGLDGFATRLRIPDFLERAGIDLTVSQLVARLLFWLVMLTFVLSSVETLGLSAVTETIDRLIGFIPNVIGAVLIGIGGLVLARFAGALTSSAAAAAGLLSAPRLGFVTQLLIAGLVLVVAVEQVGIDTEVLVLPLTVTLGTAGFGIGLAFALGCRSVIGHIMAGHFLKQTLPRDVQIEIAGKRGLVERVGAVETVLRNDEERIAIPNARFLEEIVTR